ncbi:MAG TPA: amylo-alpha-1,6-glucosidase [Longimicrobiales bacterium]
MTTLPRAHIIGAGRLRDFASASRLEWIETDGRGGYASSTATGTNTRRYHGLLVVARRPPTDRIVLLSRLEETLVTPRGERHDLAANVYPGVVHPQGYRFLDEFRLDPWPVWRYRIGPLTLTRTLFVARAAGATVLRYRLEGGGARLELRPLVAGRDFHALGAANDAIAREVEAAAGCVAYRPYPDVPPLVLSFRHGEWQDAGDWYYATIYPRETERGLDDREDLYCPGVLAVELRPGEDWTLVCGTAALPVERAGEWQAAERRRRADLAARGSRIAAADPVFAELGARLALAGDAFVVARGGGSTILAGYPWFADWGRDAMVSLPGLCLALGRTAEARAVLRTFAAHIRDGLIPNRFPDYGGDVPLDHYNAADAPLWFVEAVGALADAGADVRDLWAAVRAILDGYRAGTHFGIGLQPDGLVRHGVEDVQLTWMDAKVDGWVVTPRDGRAVEINALWFNALCRAAALARAMGEDAAAYAALAGRARDAFAVFWFAEGRYLYDRIQDDGRPDPSLRPNQLFALSLPHSPLSAEQGAGVVEAVERSLLVPLGVRTLAPDDPAYRGSYGGSRRERDEAYHQGTAWPWLLGPFASAYLRVHGNGAAARDRVRSLLVPVASHLGEYGLGQIAEVVSGDPPFVPGGCFAQAWSVGEALRVLSVVGGARGVR